MSLWLVLSLVIFVLWCDIVFLSLFIFVFVFGLISVFLCVGCCWIDLFCCCLIIVVLGCCCVG